MHAFLRGYFVVVVFTILLILIDVYELLPLYSKRYFPSKHLRLTYPIFHKRKAPVCLFYLSYPSNHLRIFYFSLEEFGKE